MKTNHYARIAPLALSLLTALVAKPAQAHFLWAQLKVGMPPTLQITFAEKGGEKTDAALLPRVKPDTIQTVEGRVLEVKPADGMLETSVPEGTRLVQVAQTWGVLDREAGKNVFLLQYYAKAAADVSTAGEKTNLPLDVTAQKVGAEWTVTVLYNQKPQADAEVEVAVAGSDKPQTLKTDADGKAHFTANGTGLCALRARRIENTSGTYQGKPYPARRDYCTLTFPLGESKAIPAKADAAAYALLKDAYEHRQMFSAELTGFTSDVTVNDNGVIATGKLNYTPEKGVALTFDSLNEKTTQWLRGQLSNLIEHRRGGDFSQSDGRNPITFTPDDHSPLGRQVSLNDNMKSFYRVQNNQVVEVTRTMGDVCFTVTMLENTITENNRYVPHYFTVTGFNTKTNALVQSESYSDNYAKFDGFWLPTMRRVVVALNGKFSTRVVDLRNIQCTHKEVSAK